MIFDAVRENVVVQWFLAMIFIVLVGTNTATRLKGPIGDLARWARKFGENKDNREAAERRKVRQRMLQDAKDGRDYVDREIGDLKAKVQALMDDRSKQDSLVEEHLGWDYDRRRQLIDNGVPLKDIPPAPPLRVSFEAPKPTAPTPRKPPTPR